MVRGVKLGNTISLKVTSSARATELETNVNRKNVPKVNRARILRLRSNSFLMKSPLLCSIYLAPYRPLPIGYQHYTISFSIYIPSQQTYGPWRGAKCTSTTK